MAMMVMNDYFDVASSVDRFGNHPQFRPMVEHDRRILQF